MRQITIRGIPKEVEEIVKEEAKTNGISLNKAFISILKEATGKKTQNNTKKVIYNDLDHLSGRWSEEEAEDFMEHLKTQRNIEE